MKLFKGPMLGTFFYSISGYVGVFIIIGSVAFLIFILSFFFLKDSNEEIDLNQI